MKFNREALFQKKRVLYPALGSVVKKTKNNAPDVNRTHNLSAPGSVSLSQVLRGRITGCHRPCWVVSLSQALLSRITATGLAARGASACRRLLQTLIGNPHSNLDCGDIKLACSLPLLLLLSSHPSFQAGTSIARLSSPQPTTNHRKHLSLVTNNYR